MDKAVSSLSLFEGNTSQEILSINLDSDLNQVKRILSKIALTKNHTLSGSENVFILRSCFLNQMRDPHAKKYLVNISDLPPEVGGLLLSVKGEVVLRHFGKDIAGIVLEYCCERSITQGDRQNILPLVKKVTQETAVTLFGPLLTPLVPSIIGRFSSSIISSSFCYMISAATYLCAGYATSKAPASAFKAYCVMVSLLGFLRCSAAFKNRGLSSESNVPNYQIYIKSNVSVKKITENAIEFALESPKNLT